MRRHGMDPYASAKLRALDASRADRVEIGLAYRARQLETGATTALVEANIARVFATIADPSQQRRALEQLAAECATSGSSDLVAAGELGRALIAAAIRSRFHYASTP
jgi:hypothetical protein